jgi:hypothetical protein
MPFSKNTTTLCHLFSTRAYDVYSVWVFVDFAVLTITLVTRGTKIQKPQCVSVCVTLCTTGVRVNRWVIRDVLLTYIED